MSGIPFYLIQAVYETPALGKYPKKYSKNLFLINWREKRAICPSWPRFLPMWNQKQGPGDVIRQLLVAQEYKYQSHCYELQLSHRPVLSLKYPHFIIKFNMSSKIQASQCRKITPKGANMKADHMELVKTLQKSVLACNLPLIKIQSRVPSICLGRYVDKIISSLLAYVLPLWYLFYG